MKKNYLFYGVLAATVTFVTACGSNATTETETQPATEASTAEAATEDTTVNTDNELTEEPEKISNYYRPDPDLVFSPVSAYETGLLPYPRVGSKFVFDPVVKSVYR